MSKVDGRKISHKVREKIRFQAIEEWKSGIGSTELARKYGTSKKIVHDWINRYKTNGEEGLKTRTGKCGVKSRLSESQLQQLSLILRTKTPQNFGYDTVLWTSAIIAAVIEKTFAVQYVTGSILRVMKRMGFTTQKPQWQAWQQDQKKSTGG